MHASPAAQKYIDMIYKVHAAPKKVLVDSLLGEHNSFKKKKKKKHEEHPVSETDNIEVHGAFLLKGVSLKSLHVGNGCTALKLEARLTFCEKNLRQSEHTRRESNGSRQHTTRTTTKHQTNVNTTTNTVTNTTTNTSTTTATNTNTDTETNANTKMKIMLTQIQKRILILIRIMIQIPTCGDGKDDKMTLLTFDRLEPTISVHVDVSLCRNELVYKTAKKKFWYYNHVCLSSFVKTHVDSMKQLACHRHKEWALPCVSRERNSETERVSLPQKLCN